MKNIRNCIHIFFFLLRIICLILLLCLWLISILLFIWLCCSVLKIVLVNSEDQLVWILMSGFTVLSEAFGYIHSMYHEATACHVLTDISDCLRLIKSLLGVALEKEEFAAEQHSKYFSLHPLVSPYIISSVA